MQTTRRDFLQALALGAGGVLAGLYAPPVFAAPGAERKKWNFVIILTDDQGYQDLGCYGSPNIKTPHIDGMAAAGMRFTDYYSGAPVCSPARAALLTGCYPARLSIHDVFFPGVTGLNPDEFTIAKMAHKAGYATACIGKWHLGNQPEFLPTHNGFDSFFGLPYSNDMDGIKEKLNAVKNKDSEQMLDEIWKRSPETRRWWNVPLMRDEKIIERPVDETTLTERYTQEAVAFIDKNRERPFCLYLAHSMPHVPLFVPDDRYDPDPKNAYRLVVEQLDDSTGRVLAAIRKAGLEQNTIVLFASDNGPWLAKGHHGGSAAPLHAGKRTVREGGMRVPCVMWAPGLIPAGKVCREVVTAMDILPTLAELTGEELPKDRAIDGHSILPLLQGVPGAKSPTDALYYYAADEIKGIRMGKWKLLPNSDPAKSELFDLTSIDGEKTKLPVSEHADLVRTMTDRMQAFDKELKAHARPLGYHGRKPPARAGKAGDHEE